MPRYLRWIAASTAGLVVQFTLSVLGAALAVETERLPGTGEEVVRIGPATALVQVLSAVGAILIALAVNEWLSSHYPVLAKGDRAGSGASDRQRLG